MSSPEPEAIRAVSLRHWGRWASALVVALLAVNAGLAYRNTRQLLQDAGRVAHTHEVLEQINAIMSALKDQEASVRGYMLTGDDAFEVGQQLLAGLRGGWLEAPRIDVGVERKLGL